MQVKYKFIEIHAAEQSALVRFYTDEVSEEDLCGHFVAGVPLRNADGSITRCRSDYNISLPIPAPTGLELDKFILAHAPQEWLSRLGALKTGNSDPAISALASVVGQEFGPGTAAPAAPAVTDPVAAAKADKKAALAHWRYAVEVAGVVVNGAMVRTDRESQAQLTGAMLSVQTGALQTIDWKDGNGVFVTLTAQELTGVAYAVAQHVQGCFSQERTITAQIDACTTVEEVNAVVIPAVGYAIPVAGA